MLCIKMKDIVVVVVLIAVSILLNKAATRRHKAYCGGFAVPFSDYGKSTSDVPIIQKVLLVLFQA